MGIVTISHELGAGGPDVGQALAERLGYRLIGSELMAEAALRYGLSADKLTQLGEAKPSFFDRLKAETHLYLAVIQTVVYDFAEQDDVVILGRGGQWLLRGVSHAVRARLVSRFESRVSRVTLKLSGEGHETNPAAVSDLIRRDDADKRARARYLYDIDIDDPRLYSVVLDVDPLTVEGAVDVIEGLVRRPELATTAEGAQLVADRALASRVRAVLAGDEELRRYENRVSARSGVVSIATTGPLEQVASAVRTVSGVRDVKGEELVIPPVPPMIPL